VRWGCEASSGFGRRHGGRDLLLAELTGARYHVAHVSTRTAVAMVEIPPARRRGLAVTAKPPRTTHTGRPGTCALRQQLQDEAATALRPPTAPRWWRASRRAHQRDRHRSRPAPRQREDGRSSSAAHSAASAWRQPSRWPRRTGASGRSRSTAWWSCSPPAPTPYCGWAGHAGFRAPGDVTGLQHGAKLDYDVNQSFFAQPQFPFHGRPSARARYATVGDGQLA